MPFTNTWDTTFPPDTQLANQLGADLRNFRLDTQQRMGAISGLDAAKPAFGSDAQPANWNGILFFATDTGKIYQFNNPSWTDVTALIVRNSIINKFYDTTTPTVTNPGTNSILNQVTIGGGVLIAAASPNGSILTIDAAINVVSHTSGNISLKVNTFNVAAPGTTLVGFYQMHVVIAVDAGGNAFWNGFVTGPGGTGGTVFGSSPLSVSTIVTITTNISVGTCSVTGETLVVTAV